jgi:hypothetical protein
VRSLAGLIAVSNMRTYQWFFVCAYSVVTTIAVSCATKSQAWGVVAGLTMQFIGLLVDVYLENKK